jgi:gluconate 2-dehydrogenase gamma chain
MRRVGAGVAGATVAVPAIDLVTAANAQAQPAPAPVREALETLTAAQSDTLEAIVARIIPSDENGPGAAEARAAHYIDRALAGPLASRKAAYVTGLAALDAHARSSRGAPFANLSPRDQDAVLTDVQKNAAPGFINAAAFFSMVRAHTIEGTFCDPYYGGNANFVGWDLIGYPGVRMVVSAEDQSMSKPPKPVRRSAYDEALFNKRGGNHGH